MDNNPRQLILKIQDFTRLFQKQLQDIQWQGPDYSNIKTAFERILAFDSSKTGVVNPGSKPVLRHWKQVLTSASLGRLADMAAILEELTPWLDWLDDPHYRGENVDKEFLDNYGCFELVGTRGLIRDDRITLGCMLLSPEIYFPLHSHSDCELLYIVSGRGTWHMDKGPIISIPGESHILVPGGRLHAFWSLGKEPMAAVYICS